jgi:hypothetical protein
MFALHLLCLHFPSSHPPCLSQHSFLTSSLPLFANAASESVPGILLRIPRNSARTRLLWTRVVDLQLTCAVCPLRVTTATQPSCLLYLAGRAPISLPHINLHGAPLLTLRTNWQYFSSCRLLFLLLLCDRKVASLFPCACFAYAKFHCFCTFHTFQSFHVHFYLVVICGASDDFGRPRLAMQKPISYSKQLPAMIHALRYSFCSTAHAFAFDCFAPIQLKTFTASPPYLYIAAFLLLTRFAVQLFIRT